MSNDRDLQDRSIVVVGGQLNQYGMSIRASPLKVFPEGLISIGGFRYGEAGTAAISLYEVSRLLVPGAHQLIDSPTFRTTSIWTQ